MNAARPAVQYDYGNAVGIAALLDVDVMAIAHIQHALIERVDRLIEIL